MTVKINVIGSGISGLGTAYCLAKQYLDSDITITSSVWHPHTTSDHGFGIVMFRCMDITDNLNCFKYVMETINYCHKMDNCVAEEAGVRLVEAISVFNEYDDKSRQNAFNAKQSGLNIRPLSRDEWKKLGFKSAHLLFDDYPLSDKTLKCYAGQYYVIDTGRYLPWLMRQLKSLKGRDGRNRVHFVTKKISRFSDVGSCDLIVNCSGLGSKDLAEDAFVFPIRGQYLSVDARALDRMYMMNHTFIVPRINDVAVGSVYQPGRADRLTDPRDTEHIMKLAEIGWPEIKDAKVRKVDVGIRPGRLGGPRLELETTKGAPIIHNYGHGSKGIAEHWGCALRVAELAAGALGQRSKL